ncbi:MAG TPA: MFS transporter [Polyangiaceae bacterium]|jgi:MFS family permease|nr:MFS transporter [Polyangiaceae bacterium]
MSTSTPVSSASSTASSPVRSRARTALGKTFQSLSTYNFRLFFIGQLISNTGNQLTNVALILFVLKLGHSGLAVGALAACQFGPLVALSAWAGAVADRSDKRKMLLVTQSLEMAQSIALAVLAFLPHPSLVLLYAIGVLGGVLLAFDNPLRRSFVPEMVSKDDLPNAVVLYSTIVALSQVSGPALAGALIATVGFGWCFVLDAVTYLAVIACLIMMRERELHRQPPRARTGREVREGLRYVASVPRLWISYAMFALIGVFTFNLRVALPLLVTGPLHGADVAFTMVYATMSCGAVVGTLVVAHRRLVELRHAVTAAFAVGGSLLLLSFMPSVPVAVPAAFLVGAACVIYMTASTTIAQVDIRPDMHGRVLALQTALIGGTALVGGPIVGRLADLAGGRAPIAIGGLVCLAAAGFGELGRRRFSRGESTAPAR